MQEIMQILQARALNAHFGPKTPCRCSVRMSLQMRRWRHTCSMRCKAEPDRVWPVLMPLQNPGVGLAAALLPDVILDALTGLLSVAVPSPGQCSIAVPRQICLQQELPRSRHSQVALAGAGCSTDCSCQRPTSAQRRSPAAVGGLLAGARSRRNASGRPGARRRWPHLISGSVGGAGRAGGGLVSGSHAARRQRPPAQPAAARASKSAMTALRRGAGKSHIAGQACAVCLSAFASASSCSCVRAMALSIAAGRTAISYNYTTDGMI